VTFTVHNPQTFYATVATRIASQTSKNVGRGEAPSDTTTPYAVVYQLDEPDDPETAGSLGDPHASTVFEWQVTSVGSTAEQAEWMQHEVRKALLGWTPSGASPVMRSGGQGTRRDDGTQPAQFFAVDHFTSFVGGT
jgi:hypothetical protein